MSIDKNLAILSACKESRDELHQDLICTTIVDTSYSPSITGDENPYHKVRILMNPKVDTLVPTNDMSFLFFGSMTMYKRRWTNLESISSVQRLIMPAPSSNDLLPPAVWKWEVLQLLFPNLRALCFWHGNLKHESRLEDLELHSTSMGEPHPSMWDMARFLVLESISRAQSKGIYRDLKIEFGHLE